ncbi:MAG: MBOAT family protein [Synergistaceae bacterium]|nr:MBOAT family protein [Synergistaceae bacterium]
MVFSSGVFLFLFLPALLIVYYLVKSRSVRNYLLLLASLAFYAWGEPVFVFIMLASIFVNWFITLIMSGASHKKFWLVLAISLDVLLLGVFKYASFVLENLALLAGHEIYRVNIALPIGISFFTFQMMSYVFDVYYGNAKPQKNPLYTALYISFFPQLIAGPIVRYNEVADEITQRHENFDDFAEGTRRFIYGLGKKVLLANFVGQVADNVFGYIINPSVLMSWLGALSYTLQIYFDFSGYSDMAIGLGLMFGFHFSENFNYPYIASSVSDFWHRWHISLSTWFRDYVYIPLGGSRVSKSRWLVNIFTVWLLTGIWHGANWTFILWGMIYFVLLVFERETGIKLGHFFTMLAVILCWVIFRSESVTSGINFIASMFGLNGNKFIDTGFIEYIKGTWTVLIFALIGIFPVVASFLRRHEWLESLWLCFVFVLGVLEVIGSSYNPFIYFNF